MVNYLKLEARRGRLYRHSMLYKIKTRKGQNDPHYLWENEELKASKYTLHDYKEDPYLSKEGTESFMFMRDKHLLLGQLILGQDGGNVGGTISYIHTSCLLTTQIAGMDL